MNKMAKGYCPECETLQDITPNGVDPLLSNRRQRVSMHVDKKDDFCNAFDYDGSRCSENLPCTLHGWPICSGSGKDV